MPKLLKVLSLCYKVLIVEDFKLLNEIKVHSVYKFDLYAILYTKHLPFACPCRLLITFANSLHLVGSDLDEH